MKTATEPTFVQTSNLGQVARASIRASATMFNLLSKQIYSDFYTAIWRELVANAIDAQKLNGSTRSPIVTVPSILDPYAKVRDFGCSMDHEFMMTKFMAFGDATTKETSNDFIGGFGIGSKAPLSYTEQYSIRCFLDGKVRVYSVFKDEDGCPSIAFLSEGDTDEPDGVEVGFPVRQDDVTSFTDTVVQTLQYFDPLPVLENTSLKLEPIEYDARGDKWGLRVTGPNRKPKVIVGGVAYPLESSRIPYSGCENLRQFVSLGLDLYVDIGDVEIAASRESIVHDAALFARLEKLVAGIGPEFGKQLSKKFDSCKTLWDAKAMLHKAIREADHATSNLLRKYAYWQGDKITQGINRPKDFEVLTICYGSFDYRSIYGMPTTQAMSPKFRAWSDGTYFFADTFDRIVIDNADDKPSLRIRAVLDKYPNDRILFLRDNSEKSDVDWAKYLKALGSPPSKLVEYLNDYTPLKIARPVGSGAATRPFKCYVRETQPYRGTSQGLHDKLPDDGGLYICMDNFSPLSTRDETAVAIKTKPKNVVWLNKTDFEASNIEKNPDWFTVEVAVQKFKDEYKSKHKRIALAEAYYIYRNNNKILQQVIQKLDKLRKLDNFPKQGPLFQLAKLYDEFHGVATSEHHYTRHDLLEVDCTKQKVKMKDLVEDLTAKHPLIVEAVTDWRIASYASDEILNRLF